MRSKLPRLTLALPALASAAAAQNVLYDLTETSLASSSYQAIGACGDIDGDGFPDFLVSVPMDDTKEQDAGAVRVHSGPDGALLLEVYGTDDYHQLGWAVDGAGDVNADGVLDFLVGTGFTEANYAQVCSGVDGSVLHEVTGDLEDFFGTAVAGIGDADLDGFDDFAVGAPEENVGQGYVKVYSGQAGTLIAQMSGACLHAGFGSTIDGVGDGNGDGLPELAVAQPSTHFKATCEGVVKVFEPGAGLLHAFPTETPQFAAPSKVAGTGDIDGDGWPEVLVLFPGLSSCSSDQPGSVSVHSGLTGDLLLHYEGLIPGCVWFFYSADGIGDLDGDGRDDIAVGMIKPVSGEEDDHVDVISGLDGAHLTTFASPTGEYFGQGVVGLGDLNGDGELELGSVGAGAWIVSTCPGVAAQYGTGCPGSGGFKPELGATGCPNPGQTVVLHVRKGYGGQPSFLACGAGETSLTLAGSCNLLVAPLLFVQPLGILFDFGPGWGNRDVPMAIPPGASGLAFTFQVANLDPGVPAGFAVTNAVRIEIQ